MSSWEFGAALKTDQQDQRDPRRDTSQAIDTPSDR
jgi:hypothetical protein